MLELLARPGEHDARSRRRHRSPAHLELLEREGLLDARAELFGHDRLEVGVGDLDLAVGQLLEPREGGVEGVALHRQAHLGQRVGEGVAAGVLAEDDLAAGLADAPCVDDLVGRALGQHAVLVDARLVGERVATHDRLVVLDRVAGEPRDQPAGAGELLSAHTRLEPRELVGTGLDRHHDFLEGGVAGPLAQSVDAHLDLPRPRLHARQRVGHRQPEVVVAVGGGHVVARDLAPHVLDQRPEVPRDPVADGVGDVERGGAGLHRRPQHRDHEVERRAGGVLRAELDVVGVLAGPRHTGPRLGQHLLLGHVEHVLHVARTGRDEHVDPGPFGLADRFPTAVDVGPVGAGEPGDDRPLHGARDGLHGLEVALARHREPRLDDVDPEARQLLGDLELLGDVEGDTWRLLAVSQRRVEDPHSLGHDWSFHAVRGGGFRGNKKPPGPKAQEVGRAPMCALAAT